MSQDPGLDTGLANNIAEGFWDNACLHCGILGDEKGCCFVWEAVCLRHIMLAHLVVSFKRHFE